MNKFTIPLTVIFVVALIGVGAVLARQKVVSSPLTAVSLRIFPTPTISLPPYPLSIEFMRKQSYQGSTISIEQTLAPKPNYQQYIASYQSEGLKVFALLTVPNGDKPAGGWPVIIL